MSAKVIDGVTYKTSPLPAKQALKLLAKATKVLGPAFGSMKGGSLQTAITALADRLDEDLVISLIDDVMGAVNAKGDKGFETNMRDAWDSVFSGKLMRLFELIAWVLEAEFGDFLGELGGLLGKGKPAPESKSPIA